MSMEKSAFLGVMNTPLTWGPATNLEKNRDCEGELNDAKSASKASLACMKQRWS